MPLSVTAGFKLVFAHFLVQCLAAQAERGLGGGQVALLADQLALDQGFLIGFEPLVQC